MNPTIYKITNPYDARLLGLDDQKLIKVLQGVLKQNGALYGTIIRGAGSRVRYPDGRVEVENTPFWEFPVFVCPFCLHSTKVEEDDDEFYCKYCNNDFETLEDGSLVKKVWKSQKKSPPERA